MPSYSNLRRLISKSQSSVSKSPYTYKGEWRIKATKGECISRNTPRFFSCQQIIATKTFGSTQTKENLIYITWFLVKTTMLEED